jgi:hypothetical protein
VTGQWRENSSRAGPKQDEVEVHAADAAVLEVLDAPAHGGLHAGLQVLPVDRLVALGARAADEENGAVGGGLVLDVQGALTQQDSGHSPESSS